MTAYEIQQVTLTLSICLTAPLLAIGDLIVWRQTREKAMLWWAAGSLGIAVAAALPQIPGIAPGYAALVLALGCYWAGIRHFQRQAVRGSRVAPFAGIGALTLAGIMALAPDGAAREPMVSAAIGSVSAACAVALLFRHGNLAREASRFVGLLFSINTAYFLLLGVFTALADPDAALSPGLLDLATHAELLILLIGWNFGFVMMAMQRYLDLANELATHDDLTGVLNRRAFGEQARLHMKLAERGGPALSVLAMDLDHFKRINDTYGHHAGDKVLQEFVAVVASCLRGPDQLGRVGGEEFIALLPGTTAVSALIVAERLRQKLAEAPIGYRNESIRVTVSIGVAEFDHYRHNLEELLGAADTALYRAKHRGRNCVELAPVTSHTAPAVQLIWDGRYRSGHPLIDSEHEYLLGMINQLMTESQVQPNVQALYADLKGMLFWLTEHFRHEEAIFLGAGWSGATDHVNLHRELEARGGELLEGIMNGRHAFGDLFDFLIREVVGNHLAQEDTGYFALVTLDQH